MNRKIGLIAAVAVAGFGFGCGDDDGTDIVIDFGMDEDMGVGPDSGPDSGSPDAGPPVGCGIGDACDSVRGCRLPGATCVEDSLFGGADSFSLGGPGDPITDHPDGEDTVVPGALFLGGYCTTSFPFGVTTTTCEPNTDDGDTFCGDCASCVDLFGSAPDGVCMTSCEANLTDNSGCRAGYQCLLTQEVCFTGCMTDDECRISRQETNNVPGTQFPNTCETTPADCTPADCGDPSPVNPDGCASPATNYDRLFYDTTSSATCNTSTLRCEGAPSDAAATGGDACTEDRDCEAEGFCIEEQPIDEDDLSLGNTWLGGSCTKFRCDIAGNECANDGVCQEAGVGVFACFQGCTVGGYTLASDPTTWVADGAAQDSCRDGYGCFWGGVGAADVADNGVCLPAEYSDAVAAPNTGAPCTEDADCFSPFGNGFCITGTGFPGGYCTVRNCAAPWFTDVTAPGENPVCGATDACINFDPEDPTFSLCVDICTSADECNAGLGCVQFTETQKACWPGCAADEDCRSTERCSMPGPDGACVPM